MADDQDDPDRPLTWDQIGWPKPRNNPPSKVQIRQAYSDHQLPKLRVLWDAQMAKAVGVSHFMLRDPASGQWRRLTDPDEIQAALNHPSAEQGSTYYIHTKDPDAAAIANILDRVMDKPQDQPKKLELEGTLKLEDLVAGSQGE